MVEAVAGVKVMEILQMRVGPSEVPQLLAVIAKAEAPEPVMMPLEVIARALAPVLARLADSGTEGLPAPVLGKVRGFGERVAVGGLTVPVPVPERVRVCVEPVMPPLLSVRVMVSLRVPSNWGLKAKANVQLALAAN